MCVCKIAGLSRVGTGTAGTPEACAPSSGVDLKETEGGAVGTEDGAKVEPLSGRSRLR